VTPLVQARIETAAERVAGKPRTSARTVPTAVARSAPGSSLWPAGLRVLLLDGDGVERRVLGELLAGCRPAVVRVDRAPDVGSAVGAAAAREHDVLLLVLRPQEELGAEAVEELLAALPTLPLFLLVEAEDEGVALAAVARGAQGYLVKDPSVARLLVPELRQAALRHRRVLALGRALRKRPFR
jgi:CheY-like chemotaxis protein